MEININNVKIELPATIVTIADLVAWKELSERGTAVAVNDEIVKHDAWAGTAIQSGDNVVIISAAFGG